MRRKYLLVLVILAGISVNFLLSGTVYAANEVSIPQMLSGLSNGSDGFGSTLQTQLGNLTTGFSAIARSIAIIMTAIAGTMVAFGINDGRKTFWNWILGIGLAINFGDIITGLWDVQSTSEPPKVENYKLLLKDENNPDFDLLSPFMNYYISVIMQGAGVIAPYAVNLTLVLATIDGMIKTSLNLIEGDKVSYLVKMVLKVGFFIFLITSWVGTSSNFQLMPALSSGFETLGYTAGGAEDMIKAYNAANPDSNLDVQANSIVSNALNFWNIFWSVAQDTNITTLILAIIPVLAAIVILMLTALEMFMVRIEFWTMALITIPLLSFGVIDQLKFLADKAIGAMFNLAIKVFVIAFIATMSTNMLSDLIKAATEMSKTSDFVGNLSFFLQVLLYSLILFFITKKIPELVSGLLSGNPSLSGGDMKQMAMDAAKGAANAVSKGAGFAGAVAGGVSALSNAAGPMAAWGGKGSLGANALSFGNAAGGKIMSMMGQAATAGARAAMFRNPVYEGYQNAVSLLGNKSNGLLAKDSVGNSVANANNMGVKSSELLEGLSPQKINLGKNFDENNRVVPQQFTPVSAQTLSQTLSKPFKAINNKIDSTFEELNREVPKDK